MRLRQIVFLLVLVSCGKKVEVEKDKSFSYFSSVSFDACFDNLTACLKAHTVGDLSGYLEGIKFVKLEPSSEVYKNVDLKNIRPWDLQTPEGAGYFTSAETLSHARMMALKSGFDVPKMVHVDAYCDLPFSDNNAYFRNTYGYKSQSGNTEISKTICLGLFFNGKKSVGLANDRFVAAHEYFHALFAQSILGEDDKIPESALLYSHDLDSFNEGAADFFAEQVTESSLNRIFSELFPWRTKFGRKQLPSGLSGNIYRDGMRYTELLTRISESTPALPVLSCTLKEIRKKLIAAQDDANQKHLYQTYDIFAVDIVDSIGQCSPDNSKLALNTALNELFPTPKKQLTTEADLSIVVIPTLKSMCNFQKIYELSPTEIRPYHFLDACSGVMQGAWRGEGLPLKMPEIELDSYASEKRLSETIYVLPGIKLNGEATDCRFRGLTNISNPESALITEIEPGKIRSRFNHVIFPNRRGSWYRDVALGDFQDAPEEKYDLLGPFRELTTGLNALRFVSSPTFNGTPSFGVNGYFWFPTADIEVETSVEKNQKIATWVKQTLLPYKIIPETLSACTDEPGCQTMQNFDVVCRSHSKPMTENDPQPGRFVPIEIKEISVYILDCQGDAKTCKLEKY